MDEDKKYLFSQKIQTMEAFAEFFQAVFAASHPEMTVEIMRSQNVTGLAIINPARTLSPMVRLDILYDKYVDGCSLWKIFCEITSACDEYDSHGAGLLDLVEDFELVRRRICFRLMNYGRNKELLETMPCIRWLDLAAVLYIPVAAKDGKGLYLPVDNPLVEKWGITDTDALFSEAHANTQRIFPGSVRDMEDVFKDYDNAPETGYEDDGGGRMYIATNSEKFYGAAAVLYDGLLDSFARELDRNLYILPTSINEMTVVADMEGNDPAGLQNVLRNVNYESTGNKDFLSDNIYRYDRETGCISIV
ncbi:DUF5688 family protein [Lachnospiraceae bacterium 64-25]